VGYYGFTATQALYFAISTVATGGLQVGRCRRIMLSIGLKMKSVIMANMSAYPLGMFELLKRVHAGDEAVRRIHLSGWSWLSCVPIHMSQSDSQEW
jgi:hypothetical protein